MWRSSLATALTITAIRLVLVAFFVLNASAAFPDSRASAVPFVISGTTVAEPTKVAIVLIQGEGTATAERLVREGDVVSGYRVLAIHHDRVTFERHAESVDVRVGSNGGSSALSDTAVVIPYRHTKDVLVKIGSPPENIDEVRKQVEALVEQLRGTAAIRNGIDAATAIAGQSRRAPASEPLSSNR